MQKLPKVKYGAIIETSMCIFDTQSDLGAVVDGGVISVVMLYDENSLTKATALLYSKLIEWVLPSKQIAEAKPFLSISQLQSFLNEHGFEFVRGECTNKFFRQLPPVIDDEYEIDFLEHGSFCGFSFPRITKQLSEKAIDLYTDSEAIAGCLAPFAVLDSTIDHVSFIPDILINEAKAHLPELMGSWKLN